MKIILSLISFLLFISCNTSPSIESKTNDVSTYGELDNPTLTAKLENNNSISIYRNNFFLRSFDPYGEFDDTQKYYSIHAKRIRCNAN